MARTAIHPGEQLADELRELGMSAAELAPSVARRAGIAAVAISCPASA